MLRYLIVINCFFLSTNCQIIDVCVVLSHIECL